MEPTGRGPLAKARWPLSYASTIYRELFRHRQWTIGLVHAPIHRFLETGFRPAVKWIHAPSREEYLADPFGIVQSGRINVVCEVYSHRTMKGSLVSFDWPTRESRPASRNALPLPVHASYPFLLEHEGRIYCVPETSGSGEVGLYKAESFPDRWTKVGTLLEGFPGVDNTIFRFDGRWWMSSTHADAPDRTLFLWYADELRGPWQPHARNPVKDDPTSSRSAGTPFVWQGSLYRPAQDCSKTYGGRVAINMVERLSPETFTERVAAYAEPDRRGPYPLGMHTLSSVGDATLVDGFRHVFSRSAFRRRVAKGLASRRRPPR